MLRTHTCGELNKAHIGSEVTLGGWVHSRRDHGEIIFIDIRDAYGITQLVFDPKENRTAHEKAHELKGEYVIKVKGLARKRPAGTENPKLGTGEIEILIKEVDILNPALTPPFEIDDEVSVTDETRLKYRYIDLRRPAMQKNLRQRHKMNNIMRDFLGERNFVEVETPFLTKSTPEGARDFLVPSRQNSGKFYALPQSPQLFKQILMVAGLDRYFQIARCFRDEDLRKDRQPEFTQIDIEMSFVEEGDIFELSESLMKKLFKDIAGIDIKAPFKRLGYWEAMERFGTDKPDTRFGMELADLSEALKNTKFNVFKKTLERGARIYAINVKGYGRHFSRAKLDELIARAKEYGAGGLAYFKCEGEKLTSNIEKFFDNEELSAIKKLTGASAGDIILIVGDKKETALFVLGSLRLDFGRELKLIDETKHDFLWIVDFPLFKYNTDEKKWESEHHPFTSCKEADTPLLDGNDLSAIRSRSYDLVIDGAEMGSGSIRIHQRNVQQKIFKIIGLSKAEAEGRFGFLLEAFKYGAPPHGGIAFGVDRLATIFTKSQSIRDVIAFPKTQKATCLMTEAPSDVDEAKLKELNIKKVK